jgi:hypothetical protein
MTPQAALTVLARQFGGRTDRLYRRPAGDAEVRFAAISH